MNTVRLISKLHVCFFNFSFFFGRVTHKIKKSIDARIRKIDPPQNIIINVNLRNKYRPSSSFSLFLNCMQFFLIVIF